MISVQRFEELRPYLFSIAYRMLGSAAEAEEVIQDAWLRARQSPGDLNSDKAWLATVVTRLSLDRLKSSHRTREEYVGPWLPEPVPTEAVPAPDNDLMRRESITMAFLILLERLAPAERAAFLLREVFDYSYSEVASILQAKEAAVRQMVHRAKERLVQGKRRFEVKPQHQREVVQRFLEAARLGQVAGLEAMLARDATYTADGGGRVPAARRVVEGAPKVAQLFIGLFRKAAAEEQAWRADLAEINGEPALVAYYKGALDTVFVFSVADDQITSVRAVRNPEKLAWYAGYLASHADGARGAHSQRPGEN